MSHTEAIACLVLVLLIPSGSSPSGELDHVRLRTGQLMPKIGVGTWQVRGDAAMQQINDAIAAGYRHIDTAARYNNEHEIGQALHNHILAKRGQVRQRLL